MRVLSFILILLSINCFGQVNRSIDGTGNNLAHPEWGAAGTWLQVVTHLAYEDSISSPAGSSRPNPRYISNELLNQKDFIGNPMNISDYGWGFGQFIDHDILFVDDVFSEPMTITVPTCDVKFDPMCSGSVYIGMRRSHHDPTTGTSPSNPRRHINTITHFIDGSTVYGSDSTRAAWLRTFTDGKLKTSFGNLLPYNTINGELGSSVDPTAPFMIIEGPPRTKYFVAGDIRANENAVLTSMHTLFVREHNYQCDKLKAAHPDWTDEELYQRARKIVIAEIQVICYEEFLNAMGVHIDNYTGYDPLINPANMNVFSAAGYRIGHTLVSDQFIRLDNNGDTISFGSVALKNAFFNPGIIQNEGGIEPFLKGMATQRQQKFDHKVVNSLRNFLFGAPGAGGLDLASININRGRERGLPDYNSLRVYFGLEKVTSFEEINTNKEIQDQLRSIYGDVNNIDAWVGMVSELHMKESSMGTLMHEIIKTQFEMFRDGDRFYYENDPEFSTFDLVELKSTKLSDIIKRNTSITSIQEDVFHAQPHWTLTEVEPFATIDRIDVRAYPNPTEKHFNIFINSFTSDQAVFEIHDATGALVRKEPLNLVSGENRFHFELDEALGAGLYTITIRTEDNKGSYKLIKQ